MNRLLNAIEEIANVPDKDKQVIKGKPYTMVATRVSIFRKHFGEDAKIETEIINADLELVCMKATISIKKDGEWSVLGHGHAEEYRGTGPVNKTSALENCETSAIGRALASAGLIGGEYASAFEVDNAINNKAESPKFEILALPKDGKSAIMATAVKPQQYFDKLRGFLINEDGKKADNADEIFKANFETIKLVKFKNKDNDELDTKFQKLIDFFNKPQDETE
jgi:hypothetical protein